jgi:hypothetical protein
MAGASQGQPALAGMPGRNACEPSRRAEKRRYRGWCGAAYDGALSARRSAASPEAQCTAQLDIAIINARYLTTSRATSLGSRRAKITGS